MTLLVQVIVLLLAASSLLAVLFAFGRVLRCTYRALRTRRFASALGVVAAFAGLLVLLGLAGVAWFARGISHSAKSLGGDLALAAVTFFPLLATGYAIWRLALRVERDLGRPRGE